MKHVALALLIACTLPLHVYAQQAAPEAAPAPAASPAAAPEPQQVEQTAPTLAPEQPAAPATPPVPAAPAPVPEQPAAPATQPASGPAIELAPEDDAATQPADVQRSDEASLRVGVVNAEHDEALLRGLQPQRLRTPGTIIGGYGQFNLTSLKVGPDADFETTANVRRLVLFLSHQLTADVQVYVELEWENALACRTCEGSVEVEQAFVDWKLLDEALVLRTGLLLVPMGIVNQWHEPPVFHGVERPALDQIVIPSTWRELGLGITGQLAAMYRYELYLTTTLDPTELGPAGLSDARTNGALAPASAFAVTGRFEVEPLLGVVAGAGFFVSDLAGNADFFDEDGDEDDLDLPLLGYALDARMRRFGLEARLVWTQFFLPQSDELMASFRADGSSWFPNVDATGPVPTRIQGAQAELAYDVLHELPTEHELLAFARVETYDTQAKVPDGFEANPLFDVDELTTGLTYRPLTQLAFKADLQLRDRRLGFDELQLDFGFGYMF